MLMKIKNFKYKFIKLIHFNFVRKGTSSKNPLFSKFTEIEQKLSKKELKEMEEQLEVRINNIE
jgi:hypothetical protein